MSDMDKAAQEVKLTSAKVANQLVQVYYDALQNNRPNMMNFYAPTATVTWSGFNYDSVQSFFAEFMSNLPSISVNLSSVDAQAVLSHVIGPSTPSLITILILGTISFGSEPAENFSQTLVIQADPGTTMFRIVRDVFRLV
ncbi:hypothetical protein H696_01239 [Fonticula alba]|uniref:NTF2-related export protein n=1 Tax=Fonticula alba TaxID=691883 RepID=A0A058ZD06_FONAL|nr:hypothetical protein H696_01239 [Fonticula alba]KCV71821.1 hypothetical protein H696_01239 [Fonticula alba]|eukprot:XP_009493399.1 hypothetical protein H696_01239 [Fonticula alba]